VGGITIPRPKGDNFQRGGKPSSHQDLLGQVDPSWFETGLGGPSVTTRLTAPRVHFREMGFVAGKVCEYDLNDANMEGGRGKKKKGDGGQAELNMFLARGSDKMSRREELVG